MSKVVHELGLDSLEDRTGLEDVIRSLRRLTRESRNLAVTGTEVMERELAMAITISEQIRNGVLSEEALKEVRTEGLPAQLRKDAHRIVDLVADVLAVGSLSAVRFAEHFADEPRPPLPPGRHAARRKAGASA